MVSVIIPTYNRANLIERSARSVLNQTYKDLELIIVDDGSTDNTEQVVKAINDTRLVYVKQKNTGACAARNNGINLASGEYIAFHDSDDVWHSDKLEKQIKILKETEADLVFCSMYKIEDGKKVGLIGDRFPIGFFPASGLPFGISTQTLCAKSKVFKTLHFDEKMPRIQDFEILLRISKEFKMYYLEEPLVDYYMQSDSISKSPEKLIKAYKIIFEKNPDFCSYYKEQLERPALEMLSIAWKTTDVSIQKQLVSLALKMCKTPKVILKSFLIQNNYLYIKFLNIHKKISKKQ